MSQAEFKHESALDTALPMRASPATRVDTAHAGPGGPPDPGAAVPESAAWESALSASAAEMNAVATIRQVRAQAGQLALHLKRQQTSVDHREAELNARLAAMENEIRGARLWLNERHEELSRRQADLDRREREAVAREAARNGRGAAASSGHPAASEDELARREAELERRAIELDAVARRLADGTVPLERGTAMGQAAGALEARRERLDRLERLLESERTQLERARQRLIDERAAHSEEVAAEKLRIAHDAKRSLAEHDATRGELVRQSDELAARRAALEQMRADVFRGQQEALETRLATEELWARLCGTMAPAALMQSLAQIRLKLAAEQRLARDELAEQRSEVQALAAQVADQHQKLAQERESLQAWAAQRQEDIEQQATRLAASERHMAAQRAAFQDERAQWERERSGLQAELRSLLREASRSPDRTAA